MDGSDGEAFKDGYDEDFEKETPKLVFTRHDNAYLGK
jgi:hypothetical protein